MNRQTEKKRNGITILELLIVIALLGIIASVAFAALNPVLRFQESRDSTRWSDLSRLLSAIILYRADNSGRNLPAIASLTTGTVYMIGTMSSGCDDPNAFCDTDVGGDTACVDLTPLVNQGYIGEIPISPNGLDSWTSEKTGYTLMTSTTGAIIVRACESETSNEIVILR
jgi:prepilin-type N-terminal cleavage/methylation domain-containing protein